MNIAFLHSSLNAGGAEATISKLSGYFIKMGCSVTIVLTSPDGHRHYDVPPGVQIYPIENQHAGGLPQKLLSYFKLLFKIRSILRKTAPDIIICMNSAIVVECVLSTLGLPVKRIGAERANPYESNRRSPAYRLKRIFANFCDGYVFQTQRAAGFYSSRVNRRMRVIQNGIAPIPWNRYQPDSKKVVAVGRLHEVKDYPMMIEAFSSACSQGEYTLHIYGDGPQKASLQELIRRMHVEDKVFLEGKTKDVPSVLKEACLFLLSSKHEGMPNALMEAMAYGLPCISTDCCMGPAELIQSGVNGILVPVGDRAAMSAAIRSQLEDRNQRIAISQQAFRINQSNSIDKIGKQWMGYINEIYTNK